MSYDLAARRYRRELAFARDLADLALLAHRRRDRRLERALVKRANSACDRLENEAHG